MITKQIILISLISISFTCLSQTYNIKDFGAVADGKTINTLSIQKAIDQCFSEGGGCVYVPSGVFVTGTIHLRSNINLHLESGAVLKGSTSIADYEPFERPGFGKTNYGMIFTLKAYNVSITGNGTLDGSEEAFFDWNKAKKIEWGGTTFTRQKENFRKVNSGIGDGPVDPAKMRPHQMIIFSQCSNVLVENVVISKSPFWTLHFADCDGVIVKGVKIWNSLETPNSDGLDITSCSNVNVSDCDIRAGDDAIAITGYAYHYELPGYYYLKHKSENINVSNCNLQSRSSGIRIGFEDQNTVKNINISNVNIFESNRGIGIFVRDSGSIENVNISRVNIQTRLHTGDWWGNGEPIHISAIRSKKDGIIGQVKNVTLRDIICRSENGILLYGTEESLLENIQFENIRFTFLNSTLNEYAGGNIDLRGCLDPEQSLFMRDIPGFYAQYVKNLVINDFDLEWEKPEYPFFTHGIEVANFKTLRINNFKGSGAPGNSSAVPVYISNGSDFKMSGEVKKVKKSNIQ
ncbi:MAG: glycoside hydrolase family 28 protein [Bacteroidales bacterium]|nr:glycoside hydrolase family 28 protein [Bacteroidales bacterium]